jgi:hypothetical protein
VETGRKKEEGDDRLALIQWLKVYIFSFQNVGRARIQPLYTIIYPHVHVHNDIHTHKPNPQKGRIHCWDLRTDKEVWILTAPRELGYLTALTLGK